MKQKRFKLNLMIFVLLGTMLVTSCGKQGVTSADTETLKEAGNTAEEAGSAAKEDGIPDGTYSLPITMEGGSGKASIRTPVTVKVDRGEITAEFVWSSSNYDYMIVDGKRYENEAPQGENSRFTVRVPDLTKPLTVIGDTVAMSKPHEIEYVITFSEVPGGKTGGTQEKTTAEEETTSRGSSAGNQEGNQEGDPEGPEFSSLEQTGTMELSYAECFTVSYYGSYSLIRTQSGDQYLLVEKDAPVPKGIPSDITLLKKPFDKTYLVSTSVMDHFRACGCMGSVRFSGTKQDDWYLQEAKDAMDRGDILYAGKYSAPDYELLLSEGCDLAIENTMIYHKPEVKSKLEELGIPVIVERSSYESHPLGRLEWIKLYGLLYDKQSEAEAYFEAQRTEAEQLMKNPATGKKTVFFHITATGMINVKKPGDYEAKMIELAGGEYILKEVSGIDEDGKSGMNLQMEEFYRLACEADILIYNSTIGGEITSLDELLRKNELFADFKAVKEHAVYCTSRDFFQESTHIAEFMNDLSNVYSGESADFTYLKRLD